MILEKKGLDISQLERLVNYLRPDSEHNYINADELVQNHRITIDGFDNVVWDKSSKQWLLNTWPFCKLIRIKSYYEVDDIHFEVVIEIPDEVCVNHVRKGENPKMAQGEGSILSVNAKPFLLHLNTIFQDEDL